MQHSGPLDYSQIALHRKCPRKFYYIYRRGLKHTVGPGAYFSKYLVHEPLSRWWLTNGDYKPDWIELGIPFLRANNGPDPYYTIEMAEIAFEGYVERFGGDFMDYEVITSETTRKAISGTMGDFITKPDLVLLRRGDNKIFVKDFKATKVRKRLVVFDRQFLGQVVGFEAHGMSIDAAKLSHTKTNGIEVTWQRDEVEVSDDLVHEWQSEMISEMIEIDRHDLTGIWPKAAPDACLEFGDKNVCPFMHICESGEFKETLIEGSEKEEDPWKYQKE